LMSLGARFFINVQMANRAFPVVQTQTAYSSTAPWAVPTARR
jgi:hypothetical protein